MTQQIRGNTQIMDGTLPGGEGGYTQEQIEDFVGAMVTGNTETGIAVTYDDSAGKLNFDAQTAGDARYALTANGVTNGNTHDHNGGDGGTIAYSSLSGALTQTAGTYTPTATAIANVDSVTPETAYYIRIGDNIIVHGSIEIDSTTGSVLTRVRITLPVASAFTVITDLAGMCSQSTDNTVGAVRAETTNDEAEIRITPTSTVARTYYYTFQYKII